MTRINITDDMIERLARCEYEEDWGGGSWEEAPDGSKRLRLDIARAHLEAALDRRTGPKDRRVEWDDTASRREFRSHLVAGRRDNDMHFGGLPRKSDRLKREAGAKAREIHVSEVMKDVGLEILLQNIGVDRDTPTAVIAKAVATIYRAMRLQEMKERGQ